MRKYPSFVLSFALLGAANFAIADDLSPPCDSTTPPSANNRCYYPCVIHGHDSKNAACPSISANLGTKVSSCKFYPFGSAGAPRGHRQKTPAFVCFTDKNKYVMDALCPKWTKDSGAANLQVAGDASDGITCMPKTTNKSSDGY